MARAESSARKTKGPRYVVVVGCHGGMDAILTTDPKPPAEVEAWVDVPYARDAILHRGNMSAGPHLAPIADLLPEIAILNGVQVRTANHETGDLQLTRMKTAPHRQMPTLLDIVGAHRDGQPLGCVTLMDIGFSYSPGLFFDLPGKSGEGLFDELGKASKAELESMGRVASKQAQRLAAQGGAEAARASANMKQSADLMNKLATVSPFAARERWTGALDVAEKLGTKPRFALGPELELQRALWLLENDVTRTILVNVGAVWDSHQFNLRSQTVSNLLFFTVFRKFLDELKVKRSVTGAALADDTLVIVSSELGRFPRLNRLEGKDHFPEAPYMFFGSGIRKPGRDGTAFGRTDRSMQALAISLATGKDVSHGGHHATLDDVGTTVLDMCGIEPSVYGYNGDVLAFLKSG